MSEKYRVRLVSVIDERNRVEFEVTPSFSESRSVEYTAVTPIHMPGGIQVYKNTGSRTFNIGAIFVSRTSVEAWKNMYLVQTLRAWTLPYFGIGSSTRFVQGITGPGVRKKLDPATEKSIRNTARSEEEAERLVKQALDSQETVDLLGAPPSVLFLYAYSTAVNQERPREVLTQVNINRVPVVLTTLDITYPEDVDYIPAWPESEGQSTNPTPVRENTEPWPVRMNVNLSLLETHSPREYENFSLADFYAGKLVNF